MQSVGRLLFINRTVGYWKSLIIKAIVLNKFHEIGENVKNRYRAP